MAAGDSRWQLGGEAAVPPSPVRTKCVWPTAFQEAACAAGVPIPQVRRTTEGIRVRHHGGQVQARVYEPVDLRAPDPCLDPALVGAAVAAIHQVSIHATSARRTPGLTNRSVPIAGTGWSSSFGSPARLLLTGWPICGTSWSHWSPGFSHPGRCRRATATCGPTTSWLPRTAKCASSTGRTAGRLIRARSSRVCSSSSPFRFGPGPRSDRRLPGGPEGRPRVNRRGHFSMLIAQLGHITEVAATDWLKPNLRSPDRGRLRRLGRRGARRTAHARRPRNPVGDRERSELTSRGSTPPSSRCGLGTDSASPALSHLVYFAADSHLFKAEAAMERVRISRRQLESARGRGCRCSSDPAGRLHRRRSRTHHPDRPAARRMISTGDQLCAISVPCP